MTSKLIGNIKDFTSKWHYLKEEVDNKLKLKSDVGHTHSDNDVSVTTTNYGSNINQNEFNNYLSYDMIQVKNKVDSVVHTSIALDKYNCKVGDTVTVTVTVTGGDGVGLPDYKVDLYCNGTSLSNGITNDSGVYSCTYTASTDGLLLFNVDGVTVSCNVNRVMNLITSTSQYQLYSDGLNHKLYITLSQTTYAHGWITITTIPSEYSDYFPDGGYIFPTITTGVFLNLNEKGEIKVYNNNTSNTMSIFEVLHYI